MQAESSHVDLIWYRGERRRHKTDFSLNMYKDEVQVKYITWWKSFNFLKLKQV